MNTTVFARLDFEENLKNLTIEKNSIVNNISSSIAKFANIYDGHSTNTDIYNGIVEPVFDLLVDGLNFSLLSIGDKYSGKSKMICGNKNEEGIFSIFLRKLFNKINGEKKHVIELEIFQMSDEVIIDLLDDNTNKKLSIKDSVEFGAYIQNIKKIKFENYNQAIKIFESAMKNRKSLMASIIKIQIENNFQDGVLPTRSQFIIIMLNLTKPLTDLPVGVKIRDKDGLNQTVISFSQLIASLANQQFPDRIVNYENSNLTRLLEEVLGGNCKTCAMIHLKDDSDPKLNTTLFHLTENLSNVINFPVVNTSLVNKLLILYRSRALSYQKSGKVFEQNQNQANLNVTRENEELKQEVQRLKYKLELSRSNQTGIPLYNHDLSNKLLLTQEEKHEIEKIITKLQIENNQLIEERDRMYAEKKDVLKLKQQIDILNRQEERLNVELRLERELRQKIEQRNEELAKIDKSSAKLTKTNLPNPKDESNSYHKLLMEELHQKEIEKLKIKYDNEIYDLKKKIYDAEAALNKTKISLRKTQKENARLTANQIIIENQRNYFEPEYHKMQNKLKMANEDFRERLNKYINDIVNFMDSHKEVDVKKFRPIVDSMLSDMQTAHKAREKQLSQAAHNMKNQRDQLFVHFDRILVAYKDVYEQMHDLEVAIDMEPLENITLNGSNPTPFQQQQINKLNLDEGKLKDKFDSSAKENLNEMHAMYADMATLHEKERAQLITKNALLDEEVKTLRSYINKQHLKK